MLSLRSTVSSYLADDQADDVNLLSRILISYVVDIEEELKISSHESKLTPKVEGRRSKTNKS